ncbi:unnamed protein product [Spirodela intermedia]|uniref:Uncharacterized protein n=1 Tax=Spirodela intermedia TaxID=51605 RepID=A0A7I8JIY1_SPIIN|nr:unnamed protein product [Spirodela intermedia]CAA6670118.1 unnamed protein product [Spirodela intermedia]
MKITVMTPDEQFITLDVDADESVENVKALLEVETGVSTQQQQLHFSGKEMRNSDSLSTIGVKEGDLLMMLSLASSRVSDNDLSFNPDGSAVNPGALQRHIQSNSQMMAQLLQNDPTLAQVILGNDLDVLQNLLRERHQQKLALQREQEEELALMYADPLNVETQKKLKLLFGRLKGIDENWEAALEHNPEAFARVVMLYVDMEVNGVPLKAFVDSGAQSTIISKSCAERCGLLRLLDQRYKGIAVGVGQSEILGRIHVAPLKIGNIFYTCSFTVLDASNVDFLFGLDMLRKHQCIIDLKENVLRVGGGEVSVPFLQEKDLPSDIRDKESYSKQAPAAQGSDAVKLEGFGLISVGPPPDYGDIWKPASIASVPASKSTFWKIFQLPITGKILIHIRFLDEGKIRKLVELGFGREAVIQALKLFNGNEEQAAGFLFGG